MSPLSDDLGAYVWTFCRSDFELKRFPTHIVAQYFSLRINKTKQG